MATNQKPCQLCKGSSVLAVFIGVLCLLGMLNKPAYGNGGLDPQDVVEKFCQLDAEGQRLSSDTLGKTMVLVAWPDEPGWDNVVVISDYTIVKVERLGEKAIVNVEYSILGSTDGIEYLKLIRKREIEFELVMTNEGWKISNPMIPPHVGKETIVNHLRQSQARSAVEKTKDQLERIIQEINKTEEE